ncbi:IS30 family transposase [Paeniglutamicibacter cryotolerans]|uniref:IS30 family transposase n=1 Tax=Paeniglutamicibacter cryotolerans TaxID=670079 RepID=A0A839QVF8_9MICC|nr:IS30 family transposase [Paeniglutamicibacter cryotolerans]
MLCHDFTRSADLGVYGLDDLEHAAQEFNDQPRKTIEWENPAACPRDLLGATSSGVLPRPLEFCHANDF